MPELPEAENIVRTLRPHVEGGRILEAEFFTPRSTVGPMPDLAGGQVRSVGRYGKQIVFNLDRGYLLVELRMTGLLLWRESLGRHTRARLRLESGSICFDDIRQFGSFRWRDRPPDHLGPEPLEISAAEFHERLRARRRMLKPLLLDQHFLRGLGNICVDEILFAARLHPESVAAGLSRGRADRLHGSMQAVLAEAIACGGSSISDYVNAEGQRGRFQERHRVYGRGGKPCPVCGAAIRRIVVAQRGTHLCSRCQRP